MGGFKIKFKCAIERHEHTCNARAGELDQPLASNRWQTNGK
jgi:hypothetical protein